MKKEKIVLSLLVLFLSLIILSGWVLAEERSIFVGDLIQIKVSSQKVSSEELRDKFKDFEIVNIEDKKDGYLITLRSFETGEKKIQLGDKEIVIDIKSTLNEIKRNDIFEGKLILEKAGISINWKYVFYILLMVFLLTGVMNLIRYLKNRKVSLISPYQHFMNQTNNISVEDDRYFVKLTFCFKEYIEFCYSCRIRGKTSSEIIDEMSCLPGLQSSLPIIRSWLEKSDQFKYAGIHVSKEKKQKLHEELTELVRKIEETKEGEL